MPLVIDGNQIEPGDQDVLALVLDNSPKLNERNAGVRSSEVIAISGSAKSLYVAQREYAVVTPQDGNVDVIGSEDATTCHIVVFRHTGSGCACLAHLDDWKTGVESVHQLMEELVSASMGGPEGRFESYLCGGFKDPKEESAKLSREILAGLISCPQDVHLQVACISDANDEVIEGVHYPIIYGVGVNLKEFSVFRARFEEKGPDEAIRGAAIFAGVKKLSAVYRSGGGEVSVGPYSWSTSEDLALWAQAPSPLIRKYLSTSPEQEPEGFEDAVRASLLTIVHHPQPELSLFPRGGPRKYRRLDGKWTLVQDS